MPGRGRLTISDSAYDVYLNATTYWRGVPTAVWEYTLGGYQVLKEVVELPRNGGVGASAQGGRSTRIYAHRPADRCAAGVQCGAGYELSGECS